MAGETQSGKDEREARATVTDPSFADASAKFIANQAAVMTMMTAFGINIATQMTGILMGSVANVLEKQNAGGGQVDSHGKQDDAPKVVPLHVVRTSDSSKADDLKKISGIGPRLEKVLHGMGVTTFAEIAKWDEADMLRIDEKLGLDNRIIRDDWAKQAKALLEG